MSKPDDYTPMRPIPISERLPKPYDLSDTKPQDCDPTGKCWFWGRLMCWTYSPRCVTTWDARADQYWLPHWALPLPEVES